MLEYAAVRERQLDRQLDREAWRCQECGKATDETPKRHGDFCQACYQRTQRRRAPRGSKRLVAKVNVMLPSAGHVPPLEAPRPPRSTA